MTEPGSEEAARQRFARLRQLFDELVDLPTAEREARLEEVRAESSELHTELRELLGPAGDAGGSPSPGDLEGAGDLVGTGGLVAGERLLEDLMRASPLGGLAFLGSEPLEPGGASGEDPVPDRIGIYRILRPLGEGGMGRVYEAEQTEPLVRRVALKVLRRGLGSRDVLARFRAEAQALSVMDHPNIARMLDAGSTDDGRPWFAMELVDGVPITRWAEERGLDLDRRIELLLPVCRAIQHSHSKGVIHRDLKPSNILVGAGGGGEPVPKVIDFGIAKAIEQPMLARTLATCFGELVGTPEYMSPEQAALGAVDVDTRSDVYSLGLVLYELVVGELPLPLQDLRSQAFDEICRRIREDETPRPSARLERRDRSARQTGGSRRSSRRSWLHPRSGRAAGTDAADRDAPPSRSSPSVAPVSRITDRRWSRQMRVDLDAILLQALAKDRERRYPSAAALADDLERFLRDEPVAAAVPTWSYRARKLARRHRFGVAFGALALLAILAALAAATHGLVEARRAEARAVASREAAEASLRTSEETSAFVVGLFQAADPHQSPGLELTARELLDRGIERIGELDSEPEVQARLLETLGEVSWSLGAFDRAEPLLERSLELRAAAVPDARREAAVLARLGSVHRDRADLGRAELAHRRAIEVLREAGLEDSPEMGRALDQLAIVLRRQNRLEEAAEVLERAIVLAERHGDQPSEQVAASLATLGGLYQTSGESEAALDATRRSLEMFEQLLPADHPNFATLWINLAVSCRSLGRLGEAKLSVERGLAIDRRILPPGHPALADDLHSLGAVELRLGDIDAARSAFREGLAILEAALGPDNFRTTLHRASLGTVALADNDPETALSYLDPVLEDLAALDDARARRHATGYLRQRALALRRLGRLAEAGLALDRAETLAQDNGQEDELPPLRLQRALLALDLGQQASAQTFYREATELADCRPNVPCALDRADRQILRAHWYAQRQDPDQAFEALHSALAHPAWTATFLAAPELVVLHDDPRWAELETALVERVRRELEIDAEVAEGAPLRQGL